MAAIEKLLTMGLAHGTDFRRMFLALGGGGVRELQWTDIHLAVNGLAPDEKAILYLRANPDAINGKEMAALTNALWLTLIHHDNRNRTYNAQNIRRGLRDRRQAAVVRTALSEYCDPRTCLRCVGTGVELAYVEGQGVVRRACARCAGQGWRPWSDNRRRQLVGVGNDGTWARYESGYLLVLDECGERYRKAASKFKHALFGE